MEIDRKPWRSVDCNGSICIYGARGCYTRRNRVRFHCKPSDLRSYSVELKAI